MKELTPAARKNVESGAKDGPGTGRCRSCGGIKSPSRLNSANCHTCVQRVERRSKVTHKVSVELDPAVLDALVVEGKNAAGGPLTAAQAVAKIITARHDRRTRAAQFPPNQG